VEEKKASIKGKWALHFDAYLCKDI